MEKVIFDECRRYIFPNQVLLQRTVSLFCLLHEFDNVRKNGTECSVECEALNCPLLSCSVFILSLKMLSCMKIRYITLHVDYE
jgi:hypothetical protein